MKDDKKPNFRKYFNLIKKYLNEDDDKPSLHKKHAGYLFDFNKKYDKKDQELMTGAVVCLIVIVVIVGLCYYFLVLSPSMQELDEAKNDKINQLNTYFKDNLTLSSSYITLKAKIETASTPGEVQMIDVKSAAYPVIKNRLEENINQLKDRYDRVELVKDNTSTIYSITDAKKYIQSATVDEIINISVTKVDTVIIPLTINRKQAASGLISESDVVDIYSSSETTRTDEDNSTDNQNDNTTGRENYENNINNPDSHKLVGGSQVVSILRSRDSGSIESNTDISTQDSNKTTTTNLDVEQLLETKAAGVYDEKQFSFILDRYGGRLADYERTSNIADLDAEYIIMVEVPRNSVENIISNMDNIILTIPTDDAPSWVDIET